MDLTWDRGSVRQGFPVRLIGSAGKVFLADDSYGTDNGYPFTGYWESPDFVIPQLYRSELARWIELELELKGYEAEVSYSVDQGATYVSAGRLDLDSSWTHYKVPIDVTSKTIRVRLENACADSNFALRWLRAWFRPAGAW
jgi:hypothetical protein